MKAQDRFPHIIVDTREQLPYEFFGQADTEVSRLITGDYSLRTFEDQVAIERKSKVDAYGSLGHGRGGFEREFERLSQYPYGAVVIESSLPDFLKAPACSKMHPRAALCSLLAWSVKYGVPVLFAGDRLHAEALTLKLLGYFHKYWLAGELPER